jgi:hypothetical protein
MFVYGLIGCNYYLIFKKLGGIKTNVLKDSKKLYPNLEFDYQ